MKKIVISFITLMAALLILIGFCSCGTDKECGCKCCSTETTTASFEELIGSITIDVPEQPVEVSFPEQATHNCIEKTTTWQDKNLKTDQNLYGVCKAHATACYARDNIIYTMGFYM